MQGGASNLGPRWFRGVAPPVSGDVTARIIGSTLSQRSENGRVSDGLLGLKAARLNRFGHLDEEEIK
jgi:hypothetical protein